MVLEISSMITTMTNWDDIDSLKGIVQTQSD